MVGVAFVFDTNYKVEWICTTERSSSPNPPGAARTRQCILREHIFPITNPNVKARIINVEDMHPPSAPCFLYLPSSLFSFLSQLGGDRAISL